jgi:carbonic anhydrase
VHTLLVKDFLSESYKQTLAVIGVIFKVGNQSHPFIEKLRIDDLGQIDRANVNELFDGKIDQETGLKATPRFYHYQGSLTTPPCTENVNWFLFKDILTISEGHLKAFQERCHDHSGHHNFREV